MKRLAYLFILVLPLAFVGCGGDEPVEPTASAGAGGGGSDGGNGGGSSSQNTTKPSTVKSKPMDSSLSNEENVKRFFASDLSSSQIYNVEVSNYQVTPLYGDTHFVYFGAPQTQTFDSGSVRWTIYSYAIFDELIEFSEDMIVNPKEIQRSAGASVLHIKNPDTGKADISYVIAKMRHDDGIDGIPILAWDKYAWVVLRLHRGKLYLPETQSGSIGSELYGLFDYLDNYYKHWQTSGHAHPWLDPNMDSADLHPFTEDGYQVSKTELGDISGKLSNLTQGITTVFDYESYNRVRTSDIAMADDDFATAMTR